MASPSPPRPAAARGRIRPARVAGLALTILLVASCSDVERPNLALPELALRSLEGERLSRDALLGRPWVIALWVPG